MGKEKTERPILQFMNESQIVPAKEANWRTSYILARTKMIVRLAHKEYNKLGGNEARQERVDDLTNEQFRLQMACQKIGHIEESITDHQIMAMYNLCIRCGKNTLGYREIKDQGEIDKVNTFKK